MKACHQKMHGLAVCEKNASLTMRVMSRSVRQRSSWWLSASGSTFFVSFLPNPLWTDLMVWYCLTPELNVVSPPDVYSNPYLIGERGGVGAVHLSYDPNIRVVI